MTHRIRAGQIYEACQPSPGALNDERIRIKVIREPGNIVGLFGYGKADVGTLTEDGRIVRSRTIEAGQLHESGTTGTGQPRRSGYRLISEPDAEEATPNG